MKKIITILLVFLCTLNCVKADDLASGSGAYILIEANSKEVIASKNEKEKMYPASTTKIMSLILLFEALNKQTIHLDDQVTTSAYAASMGGSQVYLEENEVMNVETLLRCIAIGSANDATVALGEYIAGSNQKFVEMMNEKAKELDLVNTHFVNATGLHDDQHYSCAYDLAMMAAYLIEIGQNTLLQVTSLVESYIREDTDKKFWLVNTNKLLRSYDGLDGLKTGYTKEAGYCLVATAKKNAMRMISVVLKEPTPKQRNQEASQLLDYGFHLYESKYVYHQGDLVTMMEVKDSLIKETGLYAKEDITYVTKKSEDLGPEYTIAIFKNKAPIENGETVAYLKLNQNGNVTNHDLIVKEEVAKLAFTSKLYRDFVIMWQ